MWINGDINDKDVLKVLDRFIEKYILCSKCGLPEMFIRISDDKSHLLGDCYSCGKQTEIDRSHKLSSYILKNPPQNQSEFKRLKSNDDKFELKNAVDQSKNHLRRDLIRRIKASPFLPLHADSKSIFDEVQAYMKDGFEISADYQFDQGHTEIVYKLIKRLRLDKDKWDRIGFILFRFLFSIETIKDVNNRMVLFEKVLQRHNMGAFVAHELILNLEWLFYETESKSDHSKVIPTRIKNLFDPGFLPEVI
jgi:hypothetical protein